MVPTELFRAGRRAFAAAAVVMAFASSSGALATVAPAKEAKAPVVKKAAPKAKPAQKPAKKAAAAPAAPKTPPSEAASRLLSWIAAADDNGALPYIVIDKQAARLFLFNGAGKFVGEAPVLIGIGVGDDSSPGVGAKNLADIGPAERTTPAGRFVAKFGRAFGHTRVLWVDYADSVALHAVITTNKSEHRVQRLLSPAVDDNRITFGCINVGTNFYSQRVSPMFRKNGGVVYILPDTKSLDEVFPNVRLLPYLATARTAEAG